MGEREILSEKAPATTKTTTKLNCMPCNEVSTASNCPIILNRTDDFITICNTYTIITLSGRLTLFIFHVVFWLLFSFFLPILFRFCGCGSFIFFSLISSLFIIFSRVDQIFHGVNKLEASLICSIWEREKTICSDFTAGNWMKKKEKKNENEMISSFFWVVVHGSWF